MSEEIDWDEVQSRNKQGKQVKLNPQHVLDLLEEIRQVESERDTLKEELDKMKEDFELQSKQLVKLGKKLDEKPRSEEDKEEIAQLTTKVTTLESDAMAKQQLITQLETNLADTKDALESMKQKVKDAGVDGMSEKVELLEESIARKDARIKELEEEIASIEPNADSSVEAKDLAKEKADFEEEKKRLFKEMEDFEIQLRMEMEEKDERLAELESQLADARSASTPTAPSTEPRKAVTDERRQRMIDKLGLGDLKPSRKEVLGRDDELPLHPMTGDRIVCPKCGNTQIKVENDRSRVLTYMGGVPYYAKKYSCKKCQFDFRID